MFSRKLTLQMKLMTLLVVVPFYFFCGSIIVSAMLKFAVIEFGMTIDENMATALLNVLLDSILVIVSVLIFKDSLKQQFKDLFLDLKINLTYAIVKGPLIVYGCSLIGGLLSIAFNGDTTSANQALLENLISNHFVLMTFASVILAPIFEELLFRGVIFAWLYEVNPLIAHILSGFIFGFVHVMNAVFSGNIGEIVQVFGYFFMGIGLSYLYEKTNNIYVPIITHALNNLIAVIIVIAM